MESPEANREALAYQTCTEQYWQLFPECTNFKYTDGVRGIKALQNGYRRVV